MYNEDFLFILVSVSWLRLFNQELDNLIRVKNMNILSGAWISVSELGYKVGRRRKRPQQRSQNGLFQSPVSHLALRGPRGEFKRHRLDLSAPLREVRTSPRMNPVSFIIRGSRSRCETTQKLVGFLLFFFVCVKNKKAHNSQRVSPCSITQRLFQPRGATLPSIRASF